MNKFIKNKSCVKIINDSEVRGNIYKMIDRHGDYVASIILLATINIQSKKNNLKLHGYYIGCGIELLMIVAKIFNNKLYFEELYGKEMVAKIVNKIITTVNICLSQNIKSIQNSITKDKALKIIHTCMKILNTKLNYLINDENLEVSGNMKRSDLVKYNFTSTGVAKSLSGLQQVKQEGLLNFVENKFGIVCQLAIILGWLLGGGDEKWISTLEQLGTYLGYIIKISNDCLTLEEDMKEAISGISESRKTYNLLINLGIQDSFELFINSKTKFIEGCMSLNIYTNTIKEILDLVEVQLDKMIDNVTPDLKSAYTLT